MFALLAISVDKAEYQVYYLLQIPPSRIPIISLPVLCKSLMISF